MTWAAYGILLLVYWKCPKHLKIIATLINFVIPDQIPYIDEIIMVAGLLKNEK